MKFLEIFQEDNGRYSSQRFIYVVGSLYAMILGGVVFGIGKDYVATLTVVTTIAATFGAGKLIQKSIEEKTPTDGKQS